MGADLRDLGIAIDSEPLAEFAERTVSVVLEQERLDALLLDGLDGLLTALDLESTEDGSVADSEPVAPLVALGLDALLFAQDLVDPLLGDAELLADLSVSELTGPHLYHLINGLFELHVVRTFADVLSAFRNFFIA